MKSVVVVTDCVTGGVGLQQSDEDKFDAQDDSWQKDPQARYGSSSDFYCLTCGFQGFSVQSLKIHTLKRHGTQRTKTTNNRKTSR